MSIAKRIADFVRGNYGWGDGMYYDDLGEAIDKSFTSELDDRKLYVWAGFGGLHTGGLAFAIATSEEEAKRLVIESYHEPQVWGEVQILPLDSPFAAAFAE